ncbi:flagellar basal body L-ring protein FlgH [Microbulbifer sp. ANSA005]|uniref:flagellar basal body L-ring protein FlgH n=1 Tax=Microbulbifer sp. ANSA005 TaxID=3243362 RepID=UPI004042F18C
MKFLKKISILCVTYLALIADFANSESLFNEVTFEPLMSDYRSVNIGDTVTVVVVESSLAASSEANSTSADAGLFGAINSGYNFKIKNKVFDAEADVALGYGAHKGSSSNKDGLLQAVITAEIVEILPTGNLVIEGRQHLVVNGEDQYISISGIVSPLYIDADNTVSSNRISRARIIYSGEDPQAITVWQKFTRIFCCSSGSLLGSAEDKYQANHQFDNALYEKSK